MITAQESFFIGTSLEGVLFGLYTGIFVIYLKCSSSTGSTNIIFYSLSILYVLSAATLVSDLVTLIIESRIRALPLQDQIALEFMLFRLMIIQTTASGCCDILAQCILIYRCWIVWGQKISVTIVPSFLVIVFIATWFGSDAAVTFDHGQFATADWGIPVVLTSFASSMAVNALVTGLIVFKILKVFLNLKANSDERLGTFGSSSSTGGGSSLRHVIFVIIESGMVLFLIQLIRVVFLCLPAERAPSSYNIIMAISQMLYGITPTIILVRVSMKLSFDDNDSFKKTTESIIFFSESDSNYTSAIRK